MENINISWTKADYGYTLVELITVLAIMAILGGMIMSMLNIGVHFYHTEDLTMDSQNNVRLAIAYITVKIRQNDATGEITIPAESSNDQIQINDTLIYFDSTSGKLLEKVGTGNPKLITYLSNFSINKNGANIHFEAEDGTVNLEQDITLRAP